MRLFGLNVTLASNTDAAADLAEEAMRASITFFDDDELAQFGNEIADQVLSWTDGIEPTIAELVAEGGMAVGEAHDIAHTAAMAAVWRLTELAALRMELVTHDLDDDQ